MKRRDIGILGEKLARNFLKKQGYHIKETNYRCPYGEVDIIAKDKDCLVFIEVRTKKSLEFGSLTIRRAGELWRSASPKLLLDLCGHCGCLAR